jgi:YD repeat-containing protein
VINGSLKCYIDPVGNRKSLLSTLTPITSQTATYNANDQVTANSYDANGNTLAANGKTYIYDSMNRMTKFNGGAVTVVYDGDGNRVSKTVGGVTTQYLVDDLNPTGLPQVVEEIAGDVVQRTYKYGLERISQTQVKSGTTSYYGYDGHDRAMTRHQGRGDGDGQIRPFCAALYLLLPRTCLRSSPSNSAKSRRPCWFRSTRARSKRAGSARS